MSHWTDLILMLAIVAVGSVTSYVLLLRKVRQIIAGNQREIERRLSSLTEAITLLQAQLVVPEPSTDSLSAQEIEAESSEERAVLAPRGEIEEIPVEIQLAIAAATVAVFGQNIRSRSARAVPNAVSPWTQQGRVSVQSSHNLRVRR